MCAHSKSFALIAASSESFALIAASSASSSPLSWPSRLALRSFLAKCRSSFVAYLFTLGSLPRVRMACMRVSVGFPAPAG